jgi:hypothetical protein
MAIKTGHKTIWIVFWICFYLVTIDIGVNLICAYPSDPRNINPSFLQEYFEQGRSSEGKLHRMTRHTPEESAPIEAFGWLDDKRYFSLPAKPLGKNKILVSVYGMSHTKALGEAISKCNSNYIIRDITAPGAPPNWSFAAYQFDKTRHQADAVILGIMTDCVPLISSTTGATSYFDMSYPYTFPRFLIEKSNLHPIYPPFFTADGYRDYFFNDKKWSEYRDWLSKYDKYYDPILFRETLFDKSSLIRLLRRAYSETVRQERITKIYTNQGFNIKSEEVIVLQMIIKEFAETVKANNSIPIIYIVNNLGRADHLYKALKPVLEANNIPYLSTHIICPPNDPRLFMSTNSHFIPSKDIELAQEIIKIIEKESRKAQSGDDVSYKR